MSILDAAKKSHTRLEWQLVAVAEAMPPDRYAFRPTPEVRTFGEQLRHVAALQWWVGATLLDRIRRSMWATAIAGRCR